MNFEINYDNLTKEEQEQFNALVEKANKLGSDDSVSFNEFNAKYKVLEQDGQIFTVVEREVEVND